MFNESFIYLSEHRYLMKKLIGLTGQKERMTAEEFINYSFAHQYQR